jgi:predicted Zn-dependent protease
MRTRDGTGSGWAGLDSPRLSDVRAGDLAMRAAKKAQSSAKPRDLAPGKYTLVLEPDAVRGLVLRLGRALSARAAEEGRSFLSRPGGGTRIGEKLFSEMVTLRSDPFDPRIPDRPWEDTGGSSGLPSQKATWIAKGIVEALPRDRYWAGKTGKPPLPFSSSLVLEGGRGTLEDLIAGTERGLLVTHFWYIRSVNAQKVQLTGLTRDGLWLVEKGKIVGPVNNLRFNDSPVNLLANVEAMSASVSTGAMVVPAMRVREFNFTSKSDAV